MTHKDNADVGAALLALVPERGGSIGNGKLRKALAAQLGREIDEAEYFAAQQALVEAGKLIKGRGRGGSVQRAAGGTDEALTLAMQVIPENAKRPAPLQTGLPLHNHKPGGPTCATRKRPGDEKVLAYRHDQRRINNPEVGLVTPDDDTDERQIRYAYDPHIDPALAFDIGRAQVETLIDEALASGDNSVMRAALQQLRRASAPYLNWTGKAERSSFEVDTVSLHVHERIDPATLLAALKKRIKRGKAGEDGAQYQDDLFRAWFDRPLPLREAIEFYKHDRGWANRLIAGDSLLVMNSLIQKESMAGQVQMIYIDPPYGIKYGSNFQPFTHKRDVKDRKDEDLTAEPEMIKAFRDTWELGIHSYLTYLRDRLLLAKELLHESGSVFVQISDENLHLVRDVIEEIFGPSNFCGLIAYRTTGGQSSALLSGSVDYILWYAKNKVDARRKYHTLTKAKAIGGEGSGQYVLVEPRDAVRDPRGMSNNELEDIDGTTERLKILAHDTLYSQGSPSDPEDEHFTWRDLSFQCPTNTHWKPGAKGRGMLRLNHAGRLMLVGQTLRYKRFYDDYPVAEIDNVWNDTAISGFGRKKQYVVETSEKVIERCLLMTTDPGDLVLDPTCGSGTTAFVAEKWGRRWITCDTSRVAVTLAKQRLMTASYDYFDLKYPHEGLKSGFIYKTVPHVTLKSIANNPQIDEIYAKMHPAIEQALSDLNVALRTGKAPPFKVTDGGRKGERVEFGAQEKTRTLPSGAPSASNALLEWEVPFDFPEDWPDAAHDAFDAFHAARQAMQKRMDASIAAQADQEILYDQPQKSKDKLRITGPFTVEAVPFATVLSLDEAEQPRDADTTIARSGESSRQHSWRDELLKTGIRGKNKQILKFAELETLPDTSYLHCSGTLAESGDRVVVSFGPEHAALEQRQVELAMREAEKLRPSPKMIVFCAFAFDPEAAKDIDEMKWSGVTLLKAQMNTDLLTEDLKKKQRGNQSFWLMGQPEVEVRKRKDGQYEVEVHGFDYFDTRSGELESGGKKKIALWLLDTDYDERSLFPRQVFFPMAGKKDGWMKLKRNIRAELDESRLEQFHGTVSLPFEKGDNRRIAVKIVDDRGIESLKVIPLE